jgi:mono/diheme cytochrome c family protein
MMMSKINLILALCVAAGAAQAQSIGNPRQGLRLARVQCAECHLVEKGQEGSPNPAAPTFEHIANISGMTGMALTAALRTSHGTMPNVMSKGSDIADVVAYILSLKDGD